MKNKEQVLIHMYLYIILYIKINIFRERTSEQTCKMKDFKFHGIPKYANLKSLREYYTYMG